MAVGVIDNKPKSYFEQNDPSFRLKESSCPAHFGGWTHYPQSYLKCGLLNL